MVFGFDDAVCGGAFAGDVAGRGLIWGGQKRGNLRGRGRRRYRSTSSPFSFSILGVREEDRRGCCCGCRCQGDV